MKTPPTGLRGATLRRSQDVCRGSQFTVEGERGVAGGTSLFERLMKQKNKSPEGAAKELFGCSAKLFRQYQLDQKDLVQALNRRN